MGEGEMGERKSVWCSYVSLSLSSTLSGPAFFLAPALSLDSPSWLTAILSLTVKFGETMDQQ